MPRANAKAGPKAIGIIWSAAALDGLSTLSDNHRGCGRSKNGAMEPETKCQHTFEHAIPLSDAAATRPDIPFKWVLLNVEVRYVVDSRRDSSWCIS